MAVIFQFWNLEFSPSLHRLLFPFMPFRVDLSFSKTLMGRVIVNIQLQSMCKRFRFCACAAESSLKDVDQNFQKNLVTALVFKLKVICICIYNLVICIKFDLDAEDIDGGDIKSSFMLFMSQEFGFGLEKSTPSFDISCHLSLPPCQLVQIAHIRSQCACKHKLLNSHIVILNSHVTVINLRFIKNTYLYAAKQKN